MNSEDRALTAMIHAGTKIGKSTLANTSPAPRLLLDAELAYRFLPGKQTFWHPLYEPPPQPGIGRIRPGLDQPVYQWDWETCVVIVDQWGTMEKANEWLKVYPTSFRSINLDSVSELQKRCKDDLRRVEARESMDRGRWGTLLDQMEKVVRDLRDLVCNPANQLESLVCTAMTHQFDNKWRPYVQGQLATSMPYVFDIIGYYDIFQYWPNNDPSQQMQSVHRLLIDPIDPLYEAGNRIGGRLPSYIYIDDKINPSIEDMINKIFGSERQQPAMINNGQQMAVAAA